MRPTFRPRLPRQILLVAASFFASLPAYAQTNTTLKGALTDPSGATIAGAEVSAEPLPSGSPLRTTSGSDGRFALTLPHGSYRIRVTHPSFARVEQEVTLAAGETRELSLRLRLEPLAATVVVSAQAEPVGAQAATAPVNVITREEIDERQAVSLGPLLATLPGFSMSRLGREGGITTLFLDGGNSNFTKVLVDGTTVNEPGGFVDFSNFTLDNVEKIEVVHGAESALFGSDAMAGVVQIFTHRGTTRRPQLTLLAEGGKFSTARGGAQLSGLLGSFDYSAAASYLETSGQGPNDFFLNRALSGNFGWRFTETNSLRLSLRNNASDAGAVGQTLLEPPDLDHHNGVHNFSANLSWELSSGAHWRHRLAGTESYNRQLFEDPKSDFCFPPPSFICDFPFKTLNHINRAGFVGQSSYLFPQGAITAGYQYETENAFLGALHARRNNQAGFLDGRAQPWRRLTVNGGFRVEANDSFGTRVVPRIGAAYALRFGREFWGATRLRFSFGLGIKEPTMIQSFSKNPFFVGNPNLRPERSRTFDIGIEQALASNRVRVSVYYFDNRFRDIVSFGSGTFFNTDLARARGTNLNADVRPTRWLRVSGHYTYDDSRVLKSPNASDPTLTAGNRLFKRPVHSGDLVLNTALARMNWNLAGYFSGRRTDSDFLSNRFVNPCFGPCLSNNPGYARFDLAGSYTLQRNVTLFGRVENLFDKHYQDSLGFPAYRRSYWLGMKFLLGGE